MMDERNQSPSPEQSFGAFVEGLRNGSLWSDFARTIWRTAASFAIALLVAVPLGIVLGASEQIYRSIEFMIDFFRSTPA